MGGLGRIYRRGKKGICWISYYHNGRQIRETTRSTSETVARQILVKRLADIAAGTFIGKANESLTFADLWDGLIRDYQINGRRSAGSLHSRAHHLMPFFGHRRATEITEPLIARYIEARLKEGASNASINRELMAIKRAFSLAVQQRQLASAPRIAALKENNVRQGFVEAGAFEQIVRNLPEHLKDPIRFLYLSGWRRREMSRLEWRDIDTTDGTIRLRRELSKNGQARTLPLAGEVAEVIERARRNRRLDCVFVFHRQGQPLIDFRRAWHAACAAAGVPNVLIHDLRRTAVRNLVRAGVPERVVMEISGHRTRAVFDRYNIVSDRDMRAAFEALQAHLSTAPKLSTGLSTGTDGQKDE